MKEPKGLTYKAYSELEMLRAVIDGMREILIPIEAAYSMYLERNGKDNPMTLKEFAYHSVHEWFENVPGGTDAGI